jgi:hypothetical protein
MQNVVEILNHHLLMMNWIDSTTEQLRAKVAPNKSSK